EGLADLLLPLGSFFVQGQVVDLCAEDGLDVFLDVVGLAVSDLAKPDCPAEAVAIHEENTYVAVRAARETRHDGDLSQNGRPAPPGSEDRRSGNGQRLWGL